MICPKCKTFGYRSIVEKGSTLSTLVSGARRLYWDEEGQYHVHDSNIITSSYFCSNGHKIVISKKEDCPSCTFGKGDKRVSIEDVKS